MFDLKSFRKRKKLNQSDMADIFNCVQSNISDIETGKRDLTPHQLDILVEKYGREEIMNYYIDKSMNNNSGIINTGHAGGHIANISMPEGVKTKITDEGIETTCQKASCNHLRQRNEALEIEVKELKSQLADVKDKYIKLLESMAGLK